MEIKSKAGEYPTLFDDDTNIAQADAATMADMAAQATDALQAMVEMMQALHHDLDEVVATLCSVLSHACDDKEGNLDSMVVPAYADGLRLLAKHYKVEIQHQVGPCVLAKRAPCDRSN